MDHVAKTLIGERLGETDDHSLNAQSIRILSLKRGLVWVALETPCAKHLLSIRLHDWTLVESKMCLLEKVKVSPHAPCDWLTCPREHLLNLARLTAACPPLLC